MLFLFTVISDGKHVKGLYIYINEIDSNSEKSKYTKFKYK